MSEPGSRRQTRWPVYIAGAGFLLILAFRAIRVHLIDNATLVADTPDDAYYYFQIALNIASGGGSTFDNLHPTNGYHPLWMMLCATAGLLMEPGLELTDRFAYVRMMLSIQLLCGLAAVTMLALALAEKLRCLTSLTPALAIFCLPWPLYAMTDGLESGLTLFFLGACLLAAVKYRVFDSPARREDAAFGALLSLAVLARLDTVFLCLGLGAVATVRWRNDPAMLVAKGLAWGLPVAIALLIYWYVNHSVFGHAMPISGSLKSTFPTPQWQGHWILSHPIPFAAGAAAIALTAFSAHRQDSNAAGFLAGGSAAIGLHTVYTLLFTDWAVHPWYFTSYWFFLAAASAFWLDSREETWLHSPLLLGSVAALAIALGAAGQWKFLSGRTDHAFQTQSYEAGVWARDNIRRGQVIAMSDCGVFGFTRGGLVVNLDGVVNTHDYQDQLVAEGIGPYLVDIQADYLAHHAIRAGEIEPPYRRFRYGAKSRLYNQSGGELYFDFSQEIYRGPAYHDGRGQMNFVIWKLPYAEPFP